MRTTAKTTIVTIVVAGILIIGAITFFVKGTAPNLKSTASPQPASNVSVSNGKQIIVIRAKGGYSPKVTAAKAGIPTTIKMDTQGTFDCSSSLTIPSLGYRDILPPSGETLIDVPAQSAGTNIQGFCAMGMYSFTVNFN